MPALLFKRSLTWSIPGALVCMVILYYDSGRISAYAVAVSLVVFGLTGVVFEALNIWWKRAFGTSRFALSMSALFWACMAIGLFIFFYRMS